MTDPVVVRVAPSPTGDPHVGTLLEKGSAYRCFCTPERLRGMRHTRRARKAPPGYDEPCLERLAQAAAL